MNEHDAIGAENGAPRSPVTPIHDRDDLPPPPAHQAEPMSPGVGRPSYEEAAKKAVQDVLYSDVCHLQWHEALNLRLHGRIL
jgi:hypothetical protein